MLSGQLRSAVIIWIMTALIFSPTQAQVVPTRRDVPDGISTNRLSAKQFERWRKIEQIVFAVDSEGRFLHPILHALWGWMQTSGHTIYLEISESQDAPSGTAGLFRLERFDPTGRHHIAAIRLYITSIDHAYVGPGAQRPDGFEPFEGLGKEERYAEVLGHELAHAADILLNVERARLVEELIEQTNGLLLSRPRKQGAKFILEAEMRRRIINRDSLLERLETYSVMVEALVWRELQAGQRARRR